MSASSPDPTPPENLSTALDIERREELTAYLQAAGHLRAGEELPMFEVLAGGVSSRTVRIELPNGAAWVLKQSLAKLRVQVDWFSDPARVLQEALGLKHLADLAPPGATPRLVFEDRPRFLLAMEAVPTPHANWKTLLLNGELEPDHVAQFARMLGEIQRRSAEKTARYEPLFRNRSFFESLRIEPYYAYTAGQCPQAASFLQELIAATRRRYLTLVHGDYSPKNVLVQNGRLILLDHEVIHWGDPAFDLGFALTHLLSKARHVAGKQAAFTEQAVEFFRIYRTEVEREPWAAEIETWAVRHTLGCLLARVRGRSPLEYLFSTERDQQAESVLKLMSMPPSTVQELASRWLASLTPAV